jgi:hypothetical protein
MRAQSKSQSETEELEFLSAKEVLFEGSTRGVPNPNHVKAARINSTLILRGGVMPESQAKRRWIR